MRVSTFIGIFLLSATLYTLSGWFPFFTTRGEPREALVVSTLVNGGGVILPRRELGEITAKPPLFYWLSALGIEAGIRPDELAIRSPSILFGAGGVAISASLAAIHYGPAAGVMAAVVLGSSIEWARMATQARVDMTLTFFLVGAVIAWNRGLRTGGNAWIVRLGYLLSAAAVLTKGPVGIVLPLMITAAGAVATKTHRSLRRLLDAPGILVTLCLCAGWYGLAWREGGTEFLDVHLFRENINRFMGRGSVPHSHGPFYYIPALAGGFFPWTLILPWALWSAWRRREPSDRFLLTWIVTVLGFYTLAAGKRSVYLLPLFPPLAVLTGSWAAQSLLRVPPRFARVILRSAAGVLAIMTAVVAFGLVESLRVVIEPWLSTNDLRRLPIALEILNANRTGISIAFATVAGGLLALAGKRPVSALPQRIAILCVIALVWTSGLATFGALPLSHALTPRSFAEHVRAVVGEEDSLWACGHVPHAFRFYIGRPLHQWDPYTPSEGHEFVITSAMDDEEAGSYGFVTRLVQDAPAGSPYVLALEEVDERILAHGKRNALNLCAPGLPRMRRCPLP